MLYCADSIQSNVNKAQIASTVGHNIVFKKSYGSVKSNNPKTLFPEQNFTDVVQQELANGHYTSLVLGASSVDLTNEKGETNQEIMRQKALTSSHNMLSVATIAAATHPELQKIIIMETAPRYDSLQEVNEFAQEMLEKLWSECDNEFKTKIEIGKHKLKCHGEKQLSRYGTPHERGEDGKYVDGVHLRGPSGRVMTTESVISILEKSGLAVARPASGEEESSRKQEVRYESRRAPTWQGPRRKEQTNAHHRRREFWASNGDSRSNQEYQYPRRRGKATTRGQREAFYWPTNNRFEGSLNC